MRDGVGDKRAICKEDNLYTKERDCTLLSLSQDHAVRGTEGDDESRGFESDNRPATFPHSI